MTATPPTSVPYSTDNRHFQNWLYRSDDFMMSQKLEQLLCMRNQIDQIEIISWNDVSRLAGAVPNRS
jgi:hypothetical protein